MLLLIFIVACKSPKKEADENNSEPFPVLSFLQSQVRHIDTSLYSIVKIRKAGRTQDTTYIRREDFRNTAQDFLSLPDVASKKWKDAYTETRLYDEDLKKVVITYLPKPKTDISEITRQDVIIEPGTNSADQVQTIYIETALNAGDSAVQKKLTWNVGKGFQEIKLVTKKDAPEAVETTDVTWSGG